MADALYGSAQNVDVSAVRATELRCAEPDTTLSFEFMLVVIGGVGTVYGVVVGSLLFVLAQNCLQDLLKLAGGACEGVPLVGDVLAPDRWRLWLRVPFMLSGGHFPTGIDWRLRVPATTPIKPSQETRP